MGLEEWKSSVQPLTEALGLQRRIWPVAAFCSSLWAGGLGLITSNQRLAMRASEGPADHRVDVSRGPLSVRGSLLWRHKGLRGLLTIRVHATVGCPLRQGCSPLIASPAFELGSGLASRKLFSGSPVVGSFRDPGSRRLYYPPLMTSQSTLWLLQSQKEGKGGMVRQRVLRET